MNSEYRNNLVDITPDVRLLRVLRNSGFNMQTAMGELLDNSVDAGARDIEVYTYINNLQKKNILVIDNGKGMSESTLHHSLTLAKELKVGIDQLGKYGMGMKTAALCITPQFEILTKTISGDILFGEFNINKMESLGEFKTNVRKANDEEVIFFKSKLGKRTRSGTILILKNCDNYDISFTTFVKQMEQFIGLTYKNFISKGISFSVNDMPVKGKIIEGIDPLMLDLEETYVVAQREAVPVEYQDAAGHKKTTFIEVSASVVPKPDPNGKGKIFNGKNLKLPINQTNQGVYFYREGRMVGKALTWNDVYGERHNAKNRFRIEINCKSDLDNEIRMNFQKGNVAPTKFLKSQISEIIQPMMVEMRNRLKLEGGIPVFEERKKATKNRKTDKANINQVKPKTYKMIVNNKHRKLARLNEIQQQVSHTGFNMNELLSAAFTINKLLQDSSVPEEVKERLQEALGFEKEALIASI
ncbi:ATP-binding protein [Bacillus mexicanus]|uniref:ATP-binding protein n=1 Tax=Bacillus mexicanus TaxID=2834415 RepID=UPI003D2201DF